MSSDSATIGLLVEENARLLAQGIDVISGISESLYRNNTGEHFSSGVGKHFRHVLDFYTRLFSGESDGVDYDKRQRDPRMESDPLYAIEVARKIVKELESLKPSADQRSITVRVETCAEDGVGLDTMSSVERELAFLSSHTVHHYAIIKLLLALQGHKTEPEFGVAPSTLRYEKSLAD